MAALCFFWRDSAGLAPFKPVMIFAGLFALMSPKCILVRWCTLGHLEEFLQDPSCKIRFTDVKSRHGLEERFFVVSGRLMSAVELLYALAQRSLLIVRS